MKKILFVFICVFIFAFFFQTVIADTGLASQLKELGMFMGVGENDDGTTNFDLDRAPTRVEALVMLLHMLGKNDLVVSYPKTHPFIDVPKWADGYVSYAYDNGLTSGVSSTQFDASTAVSAEMYLTFILRALGYTDGDGGDFYWDSPWALAAWCGLLPPQVNRTEFLRADAVNLTCAALYANLKGTQITLYEHLISEAAFTEGQFRKAFPDDPFSDFRLIDSQVSDFIREHEHLGMLNHDTYAMETHIITDITEADGTLKVSVLVGLWTATLGKDNTIGSSGIQTELWLVELDAKTLQYRSCLKTGDIVNAGHLLEDYFSEETLGAHLQLSAGMNKLCKLITQEQIDNGQLGYRPPTYEEAMERISAASFFYITQTIETGPCTILLGETVGVPHSGSASIYLIYKPGSAVGEGEVISLPLPMINAWGTTSAPEALLLDKDSLILSYSVHFEDTMVVDEYTYHEAGTYDYTVELATGEVSLIIR